MKGIRAKQKEFLPFQHKRECLQQNLALLKTCKMVLISLPDQDKSKE